MTYCQKFIAILVILFVGVLLTVLLIRYDEYKEDSAVSPSINLETSTTDTSRRLVSAEEAIKLIKTGASLRNIRVEERLDLSGITGLEEINLEELEANVVDITGIEARRVTLKNANIRLMLAVNVKVDIFFSPSASINQLKLSKSEINEALEFNQAHINSLFLNGTRLPPYMNLVFAEPPEYIFVYQEQAERVHLTAPNVPLITSYPDNDGLLPPGP